VKCDDARRSLETTRQQFALTYFRWCLAECNREVDSGFVRIRRFPSSTSLRFLDFVESLPRERAREQARDLMIANVKFHDATVAGFSDAGMTGAEKELRQRFLDMRSPPRVLHGQVVEPAYVSPREQDLMQRDLDGATRLWEPVDRKSFIAVLRKHLDTLFGPPVRRSASTLEYRVPVGRWYLRSHVDLGGRFQLACSQGIEARGKQDLCICALSNDINLLRWCGVHPAMRANLIEASRLDEVAALLRETFFYVLQEAPAWLEGLDHDIPEEIEDANTWIANRLSAAGLAPLRPLRTKKRRDR
jgi:hypothetical protein